MHERLRHGAGTPGGAGPGGGYGIETKAVLITGGSTGIGAEVARLLAARGTMVAVAARRKEKLDELVPEIAADKVAHTRWQAFTVPGHRPAMIHRVRLAATRDGRLTGVGHDVNMQGAEREPARHRGNERQDRVEAGRGRGGRVHGAGASRDHRGRRGGGADRRRDRLSGDDQGLGQRRRQGNAHRPHAGRGGGGLRAGPLSFGDDRVFVEKFIVDPRHIEIQLLGDKHGNVVYLGERECSVQRRNQKVVEEAPSPLLDEATRRSMGEQAVALAKAVDHDSAGTVEFVAGQDRSFYFLEMNTRLQVEHPVTEMITGLDLVEEMIRVAAVERLRFTQADVRLDGWAVESRVYAEDPTRSFLPSTGRLVTYRPPAEGPAGAATVRNDTGVEEGGEISIHYDPMIAMLVTHAPTRAAAIEAQARALNGFAIEGIRHNIPFLSALMDHPRWREGRLSTSFIADEFPEGFKAPEPRGEAARRMALVAVAIDHRLNGRKRAISGQMAGWRTVSVERERVVLLGAERFEVTVGEARDGALALRLDHPGGQVAGALVSGEWRPGEPVWRGSIGGQEIAVQVRPILNGVALFHAGAGTQARVYTAREAALAALMPERQAGDSGKQLLCPMPGLVRQIPVAAGQEVKAGETLAVVEAMKMENVLRAERDVTVARLLAKEGEVLVVDAVIMEFA